MIFTWGLNRRPRAQSPQARSNRRGASVGCTPESQNKRASWGGGANTPPRIVVLANMLCPRVISDYSIETHQMSHESRPTSRRRQLWARYREGVPSGFDMIACGCKSSHSAKREHAGPAGACAHGQMRCVHRNGGRPCGSAGWCGTQRVTPRSARAAHAARGASCSTVARVQRAGRDAATSRAGGGSWEPATQRGEVGWGLQTRARDTRREAALRAQTSHATRGRPPGGQHGVSTESSLRTVTGVAWVFSIVRLFVRVRFKFNHGKKKF